MSLDFIHTEENGIKYLVHPTGSIFEGMKIRENPNDAFENAIKKGESIQVILDGTLGYATSFLEEVFGGLVRSFGFDNVKKIIKIVSIQRPFYIDDINEYMEDAKIKENLKRK